MPASNLDADLASTLTPEELEAINAEHTPEEGAIMRAADPDDDDDDDDADDDADASNAQPIESAGAADNVDTGGSDEKADEADDEGDDDAAPPQRPQAAAPVYDAKLPSDYDAQIANLKDRAAQIRQQYRDGEIDIDARDDQLAELSEQREALLIARTKAEVSQEMTQQTAAQQWQSTVDSYVKTWAEEKGGINYLKDQEKAADLDQFVKTLAAKPENGDKPMTWFLVEAHKRVLALHGLSPVRANTEDAAPGKAKSKTETVADAVGKRKPPVAAAPKTLADVPGGEGPGDIAGEFADVMALEGEAFEAALARMSPAQREKFLASA